MALSCIPNANQPEQRRQPRTAAHVPHSRRIRMGRAFQGSDSTPDAGGSLVSLADAQRSPEDPQRSCTFWCIAHMSNTRQERTPPRDLELSTKQPKLSRASPARAQSLPPTASFPELSRSPRDSTRTLQKTPRARQDVSRRSQSLPLLTDLGDSQQRS